MEIEMMTEDIFRERLREAMKEKGMSAGRLAEACGIYRRVVYNWLAGTGTPRMRTLPKLARVLGVSVDWLLGGTPGLPAGIGRQGGKE